MSMKPPRRITQKTFHNGDDDKSTNESFRLATISMPAVYIIRGRNDEPLYVGASTNVLGRINQHRESGQLKDPEKRFLAKSVQLIRCFNAQAMHATEVRLIRLHRPLWNKLRYQTSYIDWDDA
jgi:predicted GIY-YIG superfamily endonuclease